MIFSSDLKGMMKGQKSCGVLLFKRDRHMLNTKLDKSLDVVPNTGFVKPSGIALNSQFIFVCDKDLATVFKIDVTSGDLIQKVNIQEGNAYKCSINECYLLVADSMKCAMKILDINDLKVVNEKVLQLERSASGPCEVLLCENNLVFFKSNKESDLMVTDITLEKQVVFRHLNDSILGFTMIQVAGQQILVIANTCNIKKKSKFLTFTVS